MGSGPSRPRPRPEDTDQQTYAPYPGPTYFIGPRFSAAGAYPPPYQNNGQLYGGFPGQRGPYATSQMPVTQQPSAPAPTASKVLHQAVIRNAVNVAKKSIILKSLETDGSKLAIQFRFDASSPCQVTVFICAREDTEDASLEPTKQTAAVGVQYEEGLALHYPKGAASTGAVIDLSLHTEEELTNVINDTYPLIIRLETITKEGLAEGHSLAELGLGAPQKRWVQSQTTFAKLLKDEMGVYQVRPVKQKIWVTGVSYELQEIYGIDQAIAAACEKQGLSPPRTADQEEERLCVICLVNERDTLILPCRHLCLCSECAGELGKQTSACPICRNHVESLLHLRMTGQRPQAKAAADGSKTATPVDHSHITAALEKLKSMSTDDTKK